jgi:hypothetical protein
MINFLEKPLTNTEFCGIILNKQLKNLISILIFFNGDKKMELTIVTDSAGAQRKRELRPAKLNMPRPLVDIIAVIRAHWAQRAYEQGRFQTMRRNLNNPWFQIHL